MGATVRRSTAVAVASALALGACGGGGTGPDGAGEVGMSARIDGVSWTATSSVALNLFVGQFEISGVSTGNSVSLALAHVVGPGTYPLGVYESIVGGHATVTQSVGPLNDTTWTTQWPGYGGEVVITSLTSTRIAGTFDFDASRSEVASTRSVTQGSFDIAVSPGAGLAAGNTGHRIQGDVQGPFLATNATFSWPVGSDPTLDVEGSAGLTTLTISVADVLAPGSFPLDTVPPLRWIIVRGRPGTPAGQWSSAAPGGGGSVVVTSVTPQRIRGTFTATLVATVGGATGSFPVSGTFDMGRDGP